MAEKILVAYFSASGVTKRAAEEIAAITEYGKIFIGFPVWWYVQPRIIDSFLESHDFAGKTIIPFATSGGSGISGAEKSMKQLCPAAKWVKGKLVNGGAAAWAKSAVKE